MSFEIEKKYPITEKNMEEIESKLNFLHEKTFVDEYFDDQEYTLTKKDIWLRARAGKFELKVPMKQERAQHVDQYQEFEDPREINKYLEFDTQKSLTENLGEAGYAPFCAIETRRKTFSDGKRTVTLDATDFGYSIAEIELMVESQNQASMAVEEIDELARSFHLPEKAVRGKVIEYLLRNDPDHFKALVASGTIRPDQLKD